MQTQTLMCVKPLLRTEGLTALHCHRKREGRKGRVGLREPEEDELEAVSDTKTASAGRTWQNCSILIERRK
eukprot:1350340-Amorphochlora_amoeboformis.AAC.2